MYNNELDFVMFRILEMKKRDFVNRILFFSALVVVILEFAYCKPIIPVSVQSKVNYLNVGQTDVILKTASCPNISEFR